LAKDFEVDVALTNESRKCGIVPLLAGSLLVCASILVSPAARADDSLWGKAMSTLGVGGNGQAAPDSASAPPASDAAIPPLAREPPLLNPAPRRKWRSILFRPR
jgi:hypothetical protein